MGLGREGGWAAKRWVCLACLFVFPSFSLPAWNGEEIEKQWGGCGVRKCMEFNVCFTLLCGRGWTHPNWEKNTFLPSLRNTRLDIISNWFLWRLYFPPNHVSLPRWWPSEADYPTGPYTLLTSSSTVTSRNSLKKILDVPYANYFLCKGRMGE